MVQKVITKKSFIGARLVYPGEKVDIDAKGAVLPAPSTPVGQMTIEQLEALIASRRSAEGGATGEDVFGENVADPGKFNTGVQTLEMARIAPGSGNRPQVIPAGSIEHNGGFIHPAPASAPAAHEVVVDAGAGGPLDRDGDGNPGGSLPYVPPSLTGKNKAELLAIAAAEEVEIEDGATNPDIISAIELKREG